MPEYRPWTPYPQLLKEMQEAGYSATEWGTNMPKDPALLGPDLDAHGFRLLGWISWAIELRNPAKRETGGAKGPGNR